MEINLERFATELDRPGSGIGAGGALNQITGPKLGEQAAPLEATDETTVEAPSSAENDDVLSDEEKVPKSRFRKTREELIELRHARELDNERFKRLEAELENVRSSARVSTESKGDMPTWWVDSWGDSNESRNAWKTYQGTLSESAKQLRAELRQEEQQAQAQRVQQEEAVSKAFDSQLEELEDTLGKPLTDKQAAELLTIVEEYSPVDENGQFESFISLDKAYEIFDLRQRGNRGGKERLSRIASTSTQGETATASTSSAQPQWGDWRKRYGG